MHPEVKTSLRIVAWLVMVAVVAGLAVAAPSFSEERNPYGLRQLFASSDTVVAIMVVLIAGNYELALSQTRHLAAKALIQAGSFSLGFFGALFYARLYALRKGLGDPAKQPSGDDVWICIAFTVMALLAAIAAVGVSATASRSEP